MDTLINILFNYNQQQNSSHLYYHFSGCGIINKFNNQWHLNSPSRDINILITTDDKINIQNPDVETLITTKYYMEKLCENICFLTNQDIYQYNLISNKDKIKEIINLNESLLNIYNNTFNALKNKSKINIMKNFETSQISTELNDQLISDNLFKIVAECAAFKVYFYKSIMMNRVTNVTKNPWEQITSILKLNDTTDEELECLYSKWVYDIIKVYDTHLLNIQNSFFPNFIRDNILLYQNYENIIYILLHFIFEGPLISQSMNFFTIIQNKVLQIEKFDKYINDIEININELSYSEKNEYSEFKKLFENTKYHSFQSKLHLFFKKLNINILSILDFFIYCVYMTFNIESLICIGNLFGSVAYNNYIIKTDNYGSMFMYKFFRGLQFKYNQNVSQLNAITEFNKSLILTKSTDIVSYNYDTKKDKNNTSYINYNITNVFYLKFNKYAKNSHLTPYIKNMNILLIGEYHDTEAKDEKFIKSRVKFYITDVKDYATNNKKNISHYFETMKTYDFNNLGKNQAYINAPSLPLIMENYCSDYDINKRNYYFCKTVEYRYKFTKYICENIPFGSYDETLFNSINNTTFKDSLSIYYKDCTTIKEIRNKIYSFVYTNNNMDVINNKSWSFIKFTFYIGGEDDISVRKLIIYWLYVLTLQLQKSLTDNDLIIDFFNNKIDNFTNDINKKERCNKFLREVLLPYFTNTIYVNDLYLFIKTNELIIEKTLHIDLSSDLSNKTNDAIVNTLYENVDKYYASPLLCNILICRIMIRNYIMELTFLLEIFVFDDVSNFIYSGGDLHTCRLKEFLEYYGASIDQHYYYSSMFGITPDDSELIDVRNKFLQECI